MLQVEVLIRVKKGRKYMAGRSLVALKEDPYRVYVVYTPRGSIHDVLSHPRQMAVIQREAKVYRGVLTFARRTFTTTSAEVIYSDPNLKRELEMTWERLFAHYFNAVWFYGEGVSEFTRSVALLALHERITVVDYSERSSVLNRYLKQWILGKSVSLH